MRVPLQPSVDWDEIGNTVHFKTVSGIVNHRPVSIGATISEILDGGAHRGKVQIVSFDHLSKSQSTEGTSNGARIVSRIYEPTSGLVAGVEAPCTWRGSPIVFARNLG